MKNNSSILKFSSVLPLIYIMSIEAQIGLIAVEYHPIRVNYFNKTGGLDLKVSLEGGGLKKQLISNEMLFYK